MIYHQEQTDVKNMRYGFFPSGYNGCSWVAVYNALKILGEDPKRNDIKRQAERYLPLGGIFGMPFCLMKKLLEKLKIAHEIVSTTEPMNTVGCSIIWYRRKNRTEHYLACEYMKEKGCFRYLNPTFSSQPPDELLKALDVSAYRIILLKGKIR